MNKVVLRNGDIWVMDGPENRCEAVLIEDGLIKITGTTSEIMACITDNSKIDIIDLEGRTVLPGFIDSHIHFESFGLALLQVDLKYPKIKSINDIFKFLSKEISNEGNWIVGNLYDHNKLIENRHPNKWDLDQVSENQPILIFHISGHMVAVNSKALKLAGITETTPDPPGGKIERTAEGEATGVLYETAFNLVLGNIPQYSRIEKKAAMIRAMNSLLEKGITSVHDMGVEDYSVDMDLYFDLYEEKALKTRLSILYPYSSADVAEKDLMDQESIFNRYRKKNNDFIKISGLKCFSDGSMVGRTAAVKKAYKDNSGNGMMLLTREELTKMAKLAYENNLQIGIHAIGDRAIEACIDAYETAIKKHTPTGDYRFRIEHCGIGSDTSYDRMKYLNILVASQPQFLFDFGDGILINYDEEVIFNIYSFLSMLKHGIHLSFSSDAPVTCPDPISTIKCAINRKTESGRDFVSEENITLYDAVKCFTVEGAYASHEEDKKGMIKEGYFADLVILSSKLSMETLENITVEKTLLAGKVVFDARGQNG